ncbi:MFS transporter, partial [Pseudonocardia lacus]|uniref:MFS transporter n=1 Tax=Pseudonocardia lacus TaxID=2835865 RepID=UPI001BDD823A
MGADRVGQAADTRARTRTWVAFAVTGCVAATYAGRIPAVADRLGLSPGELAVAVLGIEGGALVGLPLGAAVVGRFGASTGLRTGFAVYAPGIGVGAVAPSLLWLALGLGVWAAANSVVDVALNARGAQLERRSGRPLLSGLHAGQGVGLLLGALAATVAATLDVPLPVHVCLVGAVALVVGLLAAGPPVDEPAPGPRVRRRRRPSRPLLLLGAVAFCAFLVDGAATNWIATHLVTDHGVGAGLAAGGYLVFAAALVAGRLVGDRLVVRFSRRRVVLGCGLAVAAGSAVASTAPGP